jgi:hypothetical protein
VLLADVVPEIEDCYKWQEMGMHGANLEEEHKAEICACAPEIPLKLIEQFDQEHFFVCSSNQEKKYTVNSNLNSCDCLDFPRVRLCKHLVAVRHHFVIPDPEPPASQALGLYPIAPELLGDQDAACQNTAHQENTTASVIFAIDKIITLSRQLQDQAPRVMPETVKSIRAI